MAKKKKKSSKGAGPRNRALKLFAKKLNRKLAIIVRIAKS